MSRWYSSMMVLITGGAASGKSELAERTVCCLAHGDPMLYVAAMESHSEEARIRIARHRALRAGKGFVTLEHAKRFDRLWVPKGYAAALFECMGNALANELFSPDGAGENWKNSILAGIDTLTCACAHVVIVTNDIFADGRIYDEGTMAYLRALGQLNQLLAQRVDVVIESVCGIGVSVKGGMNFA